MQTLKRPFCKSLMSTTNLLNASKIGSYGIYRSTEKNRSGARNNCLDREDPAGAQRLEPISIGVRQARGE
jgi:hypothetical protein